MVHLSPALGRIALLQPSKHSGWQSPLTVATSAKTDRAVKLLILEDSKSAEWTDILFKTEKQTKYSYKSYRVLLRWHTRIMYLLERKQIRRWIANIPYSLYIVGPRQSLETLDQILYEPVTIISHLPTLTLSIQQWVKHPCNAPGSSWYFIINEFYLIITCWVVTLLKFQCFQQCAWLMVFW